ncbi:MAG: hypothetical protein F4Y16_05790 [Holophagales bacterium]|nr:hypothetical protein [Holophagales bacterium]MYH27005.1 hypothetical protein [Holophagales bacterium]
MNARKEEDSKSSKAGTGAKAAAGGGHREVRAVREASDSDSRRERGGNKERTGRSGSAGSTNGGRRVDPQYKKSYKLLFGVQRSIRYHSRRRAWFEFLHSATIASSLVLTGAFPIIFGDDAGVLKITSVSAAVILSIGLVVGYARKAAQHHVLSSKFAVLESKMVPLDQSNPYSNAEYEKFFAERTSLEVEEPARKNLLNALCDYELRRATRRDLDEKTMAALSKIPWRRHATAQLFSQATYVHRELKS